MWEGLGSNNNLGSYWLRAGPFRWEQLLSSCETFCCQSGTAPRRRRVSAEVACTFFFGSASISCLIIIIIIIIIIMIIMIIIIIIIIMILIHLTPRSS